MPSKLLSIVWQSLHRCIDVRKVNTCAIGRTISHRVWHDEAILKNRLQITRMSDMQHRMHRPVLVFRNSTNLWNDYLHSRTEEMLQVLNNTLTITKTESTSKSFKVNIGFRQKTDVQDLDLTGLDTKRNKLG